MGQAQQKRRTVLIVEDDAELRRLTAVLFEDEQVDTMECESAEAALGTLLIGGREVAMTSARARRCTSAWCRLLAQVVAVAQRADRRCTGPRISRVMCGVSRPARPFWRSSNVRRTVASSSDLFYRRRRPSMSPKLPVRPQASAARLGRYRLAKAARSGARISRACRLVARQGLPPRCTTQ